MSANIASPSFPILEAHDLPSPAPPVSKNDLPISTSALTPPTSEDMNARLHDDNSSELSDLDEDDITDQEPIVPDHYYGGGKIPVFKPTMAQFRSFKKYVERIDHYGMKSGIVKVIPPMEWTDSLHKLDDLVKSIRIKNPIMQEFTGAHGIHTQANIEKQRSYNLAEWKALTEETQHQPPARRGERRKNQERIVRGGSASARGRGSAARSRRGGRSATAGKSDVATQESQTAQYTTIPPTPFSPPSAPATDSIEQPDKPRPTKKQRARPGPKPDQNKSVSSRRMNNRSEKVDVIDEAAFQGFDYKLDNLDEYTPERCAELETSYWKSLTFAAPMYAADMPGSLFTDDITSWNVSKLENLLDVLGTKVPGVNTAYLYLGMWKATFAWHLEDVDLYSINYIHFGAPKQWYSISQEDARRFEAAMRQVWPNDSRNCDQFLRHKTYLISPALLKERYNITVNKLVHHEGEFVITYPYGYHSGYNLGYNCAESVNFALESWMEYGKIARKCECESDSVWVNVYDIERKLRGEVTPEYYEETDDDGDEPDHHLLTPPASIAGKAKRGSCKRKRDSKSKEGANQPQKKRIRIRIKTSTREPCVLCPNDAAHEPLMSTDDGRKVHRVCVLYTPETYISNKGGEEVALGVNGIDKARLDLKCNFCRSKRGACFQCAHKKCTRAYHATCALAAGVQIDAGLVPTFGEDGTEYYEEGFDIRCRYHRPKPAKNLTVDVLENSKLISNFARTVKQGDAVQFQYPGHEIFAGLVIENRSSELSLLVDVQPDGDRIEAEWKWLVVLDPRDSLRPKPSASAIPMPLNMNKQSVSIDNRQDGMPVMEEPFHDISDYKWAEFVSLERPPQGYAPGTISDQDPRVFSLTEPDKVFFYLPGQSTGARSKYANDPSSETPSQAADFLAQVKPPPPVKVSKPQSVSARPGSVCEASIIEVNNAPTKRRPSGQFPEDAYYSSKVLPAAFPGQYSNYIQHVRQNSVSHEARPPLGSPTWKAGVAQDAAATISTAGNGGLKLPPINSAISGFGQPPSSDHVRPWTPPSHVFQSLGLDRAPCPPAVTTPALTRTTHQTMQDFRQQLVQPKQPTVVARSIAAVHQPSAAETNSPFRNGYVSAGAYKQDTSPDVPYQSPKQPTISPLSSTQHTPDGHGNLDHPQAAWD